MSVPMRILLVLAAIAVVLTTSVLLLARQVESGRWPAPQTAMIALSVSSIALAVAALTSRRVLLATFALAVTASLAFVAHEVESSRQPAPQTARIALSAAATASAIATLTLLRGKTSRKGARA